MKLARARIAFDGLAFPARGDGMWSWSNPKTARWFPQREPLASLDFLKRDKSLGKAAARMSDARALAEVRAGLETGTAAGTTCRIRA